MKSSFLKFILLGVMIVVGFSYSISKCMHENNVYTKCMRRIMWRTANIKAVYLYKPESNIDYIRQIDIERLGRIFLKKKILLVSKRVKIEYQSEYDNYIREIDIYVPLH